MEVVIGRNVFDTSSMSLDDMFYLQDIEQRKLYANEDIDRDSVAMLVRHILQYNKDDFGKLAEDRQPIIIYLTSNGGDVDAGFQLIDVIATSTTPVYTVNLGQQYSMGFLIGLAGHKRFAMPNSKYLMHDGSSFAYGSGTKVQDQIAFQGRVDEKIKSYILSRSNVTPEEYDSKLRVEWYLLAEEAKEKGFTDYIVGIDCDMNDII